MSWKFYDGHGLKIVHYVSIFIDTSEFYFPLSHKILSDNEHFFYWQH